MKLLDKFISKIGYDKVLHLFVGALISGAFGYFGVNAAIAGWPVTLMIGAAKEMFDDKADKKDLIYTMIGATIGTATGVIVNLL